MKTNILKHIALMCLTVLALQSCIEEYVAELPAEDTNLLVVEGTIISGERCTFYLSRTIPTNANNSGIHRTNAKLTITGSDGFRLDVPQITTSSYSVNVPKLNDNVEYSLEIESDGDTYRSDPQKPFRCTPIEAVEYDQPESYGSINVLLTTAVPENPKEVQYYRWYYNEVWELRAKYKSKVKWDPAEKTGVPAENDYLSVGWRYSTSREIIASSSAYYSNNQISKYALYRIPSYDHRLEAMYSTEIVQRSISKEEYEYENERRRISQDMGGLFTPQPSVLPSNVHCTTSSRRIIGYVGCSAGLQRKRIFIDPSNLETTVDKSCKAYYSYEDGFMGDEEMYKQGLLLFMWSTNPDGIVDSGWTTIGCLDVTHRGGTPDKPSFWPQ